VFYSYKGPRDSLLERVQQKSMETRWYQDRELQRVGVIIYDVLDNDWQAVTLEDYGLGTRPTRCERLYPQKKRQSMC
jgi:hypothetical protein